MNAVPRPSGAEATREMLTALRLLAIKGNVPNADYQRWEAALAEPAAPSATATELLEIACRLISFTGEPGAWKHCSDGWISRAIDWRDRYEALDSGQAPAEAGPEVGKLAAIRGLLDEFSGSFYEVGEARNLIERIEQIAGSSRTASGIEPGGSASLLPADVVTVLDALCVAAEAGRDRAARAAYCPDCRASPADLCDTCLWRLRQADEYERLAAKLGGAS